MKISPLGAFVVAIGVVVGIIIWIFAYFGLPNADTHRDLAQNPPIQSSAVNFNGTTDNMSNSSTSPLGAGVSSATTFYTLDKTPKTLDLNLLSSDMSQNSGLNFNGFANGELVVTVPTGWTVKISYTNKESMPHSIGITDWSDRNAGTGTFPAAFSGSIGPNFSQGITASNPAITYSFKADKAGKYAMVCGIPGHAAGGMWDEFDVSATAKAPTVKTPQGVVTVK